MTSILSSHCLQTENSALENRTSGSFFSVSEVKYEGDKIQQTAWGPNQLCYRIKPSLEPMGSLFFIVSVLYASSVVTEIHKTVLSWRWKLSRTDLTLCRFFTIFSIYILHLSCSSCIRISWSKHDGEKGGDSSSGSRSNSRCTQALNNEHSTGKNKSNASQ
jgi:hypothetical protein